MRNSPQDVELTDAEVEQHLREERAREKGQIAASGEILERRSPAEERQTWSASDLIQHAKEHPPKPIIEGLLNAGDTLLIHGSEENYKSILVVQIAESIATGKTLMRRWHIRGRRRVGVLQTEMQAAMLGERLGRMFPTGNAPENIRFVGDEFLREWRRKDLKGKFEMVQKWIADDGLQVLMIDPANDFFRGEDNPCDERNVGEFFDMLRGFLLVRGSWCAMIERRKTLTPRPTRTNSFEVPQNGKKILRPS